MIPSSSTAPPTPRIPKHNLDCVRSTVTCPGYRLAIGNAVAEYPLGIHVNGSIPWSVHIKGTDIVLVADDCEQTLDRAPGTKMVISCSSCAALDRHTIVMGIRHRAAAGAHESTPWAYLSTTHTAHLLKRKNKQIDELIISISISFLFVCPRRE
jgi:hypothetical protein